MSIHLMYLEDLRDLLTSGTSETTEALADARASVAVTTATAVITSGRAIARVFLNGIVRNRTRNGGGLDTVGLVPLADQDGVSHESNQTWRLAGAQGILVAGVRAHDFPLTVLGAGLLVHGIICGGAFDLTAVDTTEADITQASVLHASIPGFVVCDKEVVIVRSLGDGGARHSFLLFVHGLREVNGKVLVAAASSVTRAVVGA